MNGAVSKKNQYIIFVVGALLFILGVFIFTRTIAVEDLTLWLPATLILAGILILPGASRGIDPDNRPRSNSAFLIIALVLMLVGGFLILRTLGIISSPILRYALGASLSAIGLYGMVSSTARLWRERSDTEQDV